MAGMDERVAELVKRGLRSPLEAQRVMLELEELRRRPPDEPVSGPTRAHSMHAPEPGEWIASQPAPNQLLQCPPFGGIAPAAPPVPVQVQFRGGSGLIIGWRGSVIDLTVGPPVSGIAQYAAMEVQLSFQGRQEQIITDGQAAQFADFAELFWHSNAPSWAPLMLRVTTDDILTVTCQNRQAAIVGAQTLTPNICFAFLADNPR